MSLTSYRAAPPREKIGADRFRADWYLAIATVVVKTDQQETVILLVNPV
jgi:hypothetical protein